MSEMTLGFLFKLTLIPQQHILKLGVLNKMSEEKPDTTKTETDGDNSCKGCGSFEGNTKVKFKNIEDKDQPRLVCCVECKKVWFRDSAEKFTWRHIPYEIDGKKNPELEKVQSEHKQYKL